MNKAFTIKAVVLVLLCLFVSFMSLGCRFFSNSSPKAKKIAGEVEITPEWKEIVPAAPLETNEEIQFVGLKLENIKSRSETDRYKLLKNDGGLLQVDVELIDKAGNSLKLFPIGVAEFVEFGTGNILPKDASYQKIRIRSDEKILVKEIIWGDSSAW